MASQDGEESTLFVRQQGDTDDDDDISLTSTIDGEGEEDGTREYNADCILAERPSQNEDHEEGAIEYLVKWEDYNMDQSTWEPFENLSEGLWEQWCHAKQRDPIGEQRKLNLREYEEACLDAIKCKAARHRRRNVKRQRMGLELTSPLPGDSSDNDSSASMERSNASDSMDESESSDEAHESNEIEQGSIGKVLAPSIIKQTTFKGIPPINGTSRTSPPRRQSAGLPAGRPTTGATYQGTARKPSAPIKTAPMATASKAANMAWSAPSTSGLANRFQLKAVRSGSAPNSRLLAHDHRASAPAHKVRKKRTSLKESMVDTTKEPKLFKNMKRLNQARKRGIELNDAAPLDLSAIPANFLITGEQPKRTQSLDMPAGQPAANVEPTRGNSDMIQTGPSTSVASDPQKSRRGLSVRFDDSMTKVNVFDESDLDTPAIVDEPVDIDNTLEPTDYGDSTVNTSTATPRRLSLSQYRERSGTQTVARIVTFGRASRETRALFNGITRISQPWLTQFMAEDHLVFSLTCTAADFFGQPLYRPEKRLSRGNIEFRRDAAAAEAIATRLSKTTSAFYLAREEYSILVYPSNCEAWKPLIEPSIPNLSDGLLRHVIFQTAMPLKLALYPSLPTTATEQDDIDTTPASICDAVMKQLFDKDVSNVVKDQNTFVLIYYPADEYLFQVMSLWLRAMRPRCRIFASRMQGSWNSFCKANIESATIVFHESVLDGIRKIPQLWSVLQYRAHNFWSISASTNTTKPWPTMEGEIMNPQSSSIPVQLSMTRIFPHGRAILITPSFAVSQPRVLCRVLERFKARATFAPVALIACANFPEYLRTLYCDKAREIDDQMLPKGPEPECMGTIKDRIRACELVTSIADSRQVFRLGGTPEDIAKTVWADDVLAPDDEQSLVNWFAAWSSTRLANYRKFYVLGTDARDEKWSHRTVRIPNYSADTVSDPDVLYAREAQKQQDAAGPPSSQATARVRGAPPYPHTALSGVFTCRNLAYEIREWALKFLTDIAPNSWSRLYAQPVSWADIEMADGFCDPLCKYATFATWFYHMHRFSQGCNTLMGFFYTIDTEWDGTKQSPNPPRHPWVAIYRPADPHKNKDNYTRMELLIWDAAAESRPPTQPGPMSKLLPMQRRLIDFVSEEAPKRFASHFLDRVWLGSFSVTVGPEPSSYPIDATCQTIENFLVDSNKWINAWITRLQTTGWKQLDYPAYKAWLTKRPGFSHADDADREPEPFIKATGDLSQPPRMVFHPPQGNAQGRTRCTNDLYEAALDARKKNPDCDSFSYQFRPTTQWYRELVEEGRGYSYIKVDSWREIADECLGPHQS